MSTANEINLRIAAAAKNIDDRVKAMTKQIDMMNARMNAEVTRKLMIESYRKGEPIEHYKWNREYSFRPGRRCYISKTLLLPGTQAYRGILSKDDIKDNPIGFIYMPEIWLSKEEFVIRRLKGLVW